VHLENPSLPRISGEAAVAPCRIMRSPDALLVEQIRHGDAEAARRFVREQYPGVYRYLLCLTGSREAAEDLTQETFVQAWRSLDLFEGRASLRAWLHRIARREFLQALRGQRPEISLEAVAEVAEPRAAELAEAVEMRAVLRKLPLEEREIVALHYLEGYRCEEIAGIVGLPVGTVKYRLSEARARLRRELIE
jgi:RNA polymerase sigma-70 factor, ECF subfamily